MSIWHNKAIPTTEKDKYVYVEFYTQIPYTDRETLSRCVTPASDCGDLEEPDLIRWCYLDDLLNQQAEIDRLKKAINSALNFMACPDDLSELTGKCNDQAAFDVLREALNGESEKR